MRALINVDLEAIEEFMHGICGPAGGIAAELAAAHLSTGGKRLRAKLALCIVDCLLEKPQDPKLGIAWASACELLHQATLVHDDIEDGDRVRRNHPTLWVQHGVPQAVNAGDLLWVLPYTVIASMQTDALVKNALFARVAAASVEVIRGQAAELRLTSERSLSFCPNAEDYEKICLAKTGALFQLPVHGAALLAGCSEMESQEISFLFKRVGLLFQMQDDVLDLYGDKGRAAVGGDLKEGKISVLVVAHTEICPDERNDLLRCLWCDPAHTSQADVLHWIQRFRDSGALKNTLLRMVEVRNEVLQEVKAHAFATQIKAIISDLLALILEPIEGVMRDTLFSA